MSQIMEKQRKKAEKLLEENRVKYAGYKNGYYIFKVTTGDTKIVRIKDDKLFDCVCADWSYRGHIRPCKHGLASIIAKERFFSSFKIRDDTNGSK